MKRMTKIFPSGNYGIVGDIDDAVLRLAAYEDTGLEPEEIIELKARMEGLEK